MIPGRHLKRLRSRPWGVVFAAAGFALALLVAALLLKEPQWSTLARLGPVAFVAGALLRIAWAHRDFGSHPPPRQPGG